MPGSRRRSLAVIVFMVGTLWATPTPAAVKKPDVVPTSLSVASGSSTITPGTTAPLQVAISNLGAATAYSVTVTISLTANGTTSQVSKSSVGTLTPGASGTVATTLPVPSQVGTYQVTATASAWRDANRTNNSLSKTIQVKSSSTTTGTSTPTSSPAAAPAISTLTPSSATAGGTAFSLVVDGSNFGSGASVLWNGTARSTTFVSATRVTASIPSSDLGAAGSTTVTVRNADTEVSNPLTFTVNPAPATTTACTTGQFRAEYFVNTSLTAPATRTACESSINYDWGTGGPAGLPVDAFSVRWTGRFSFAAGSYTFTARADDGIRIFVDGVAVISAWVVQAPTMYTATQTLTAGEHEVKVEYFENYAGAVAQVSWAPTPAPSTTTSTTQAAAGPGYYASPTGSGTVCTLASPCTIQQGIVKVAPGDTLYLLDGIYKGASQMLNLAGYAPSKSGTASQRISVRALNDGAVWIDGGYSYHPLVLSGNQYWTIEGINVYNSAGSVAKFAPGSHNNVVKRVCAWNASGTNEHVWLLWDSGFNLLEDICGFGTGRNVLIDYGSGASRNTIRRAWLRWEGWPPDNGAAAPGPPVQTSYATPANTLFENLIMIWSAERYNYPQPTWGSIFGGMHFRDAPPAGSPGYRIRGAIVYGHSNPKLPLNHSFANQQDSPSDIKDFYVDGSSQGHVWPILLGCKSGTCTNSLADRVTAIRGATPSVVSSSVTISNFYECTSVGGCPSLYTGTGANACYRYQDGSLSSNPLWPWPMDTRIKTALSAAESSALSGTDRTVTSEIESKFGPIPSSCRN